jgi:hypothetical protein
MRRIEHDRTDRLAQRRAAGFAHLQQRHTTLQQMIMQPFEQGAFAGAFAALKRDETSARIHWQCFNW